MAKKKPDDQAKKKQYQLTELDQKTLKLIEATAQRVQAKILARNLPEMRFPTRSLSNVKYDTKVGYFELGRGTTGRLLVARSPRLRPARAPGERCRPGWRPAPPGALRGGSSWPRIIAAAAVRRLHFAQVMLSSGRRRMTHISARTVAHSLLLAQITTG